MNNKNIKNYLKLEYQIKKNCIFQNIEINENKKTINNIIRFFILKIALIILLFFYYFQNSKNSIKKNKTRYDIDFNFNFVDYENNIISMKMKRDSEWILTGNEPYFLNGLLRKFQPKNCLEIGVANGGSSILILNAIKNIPYSRLISLDLNTQLFYNQSKKTGYRVKQYFRELTKNWKLFTGQQPHKFLMKLN